MKAILTSLFEKQTLTRQAAKQALQQIVAGRINAAQITAFITTFLMRNITLEELDGFRDALLETGTRIDLDEYDPIDLCGTGGDNKNTFNISTLSAFVVAGASIPVAKHGNYSVSSSCGSSNVLEYFGYTFSDNEVILKKQIEEAGICFLHAPLFQPGLKKVAGIRKELQVKTFFNMLGPLINPACPKKQLLGVYSMELAELYSGILKQTSGEYSIVHSLDGFDEVSLTGPYRIISRGSDKIHHPGKDGFQKVNTHSIKGGDSIKESADIFINVLRGKGTFEQNEVVLANASIAIGSYYPHLNREEAIDSAKESLLGKKALNVFNKITNN